MSFWSNRGLTSFDMNCCFQEHRKTVPEVLLPKAFTALQAATMSSNTTTALCRPQGVTDWIGPNSDSFWVTDSRFSVGCMLFFSHLPRKHVKGRVLLENKNFSVMLSPRNLVRRCGHLSYCIGKQGSVSVIPYLLYRLYSCLVWYCIKPNL